MTLERHIEEIRSGIKAGRFSNEASVSQGIVLRILSALSWPAYDTQIVSPEFSLEGRRVDFALCHPPQRPIAFIEVKQIGQSEGAERQLFEYAFHAGVQLAILTDGQEWNFFLPAERGDYGERRVYRLDLLQRDINECTSRLMRYLSYDRVVAGDAISSARQDYQNIAQNREMAATLPQAWEKLVSEEDDLLLELIADRVESLCGFKPDLDSVAKFLKENVALKLSNQNQAPQARPPVNAAPAAALPHAIGNIGFTLNGRHHECRSAKAVLVGVFEELSNLDSTFAERFAALPTHGRRRRYLARTAEELYPGREDLARDHSTRLPSGLYLGTNVSRAAIERIVEMACEVANIRFGTQLTINLG